jgi:hypothetical protein
MNNRANWYLYGLSGGMALMLVAIVATRYPAAWAAFAPLSFALSLAAGRAAREDGVAALPS